MGSVSKSRARTVCSGRLNFHICADVLRQRLMINHLRGGDILDGDADGFVECDFTRADSSCLGAGEDFADLAMDIVCADGLFFEREQDVATLGHDRVARVDHDLGAFQCRAVDFTQIGTVRADGVDVDARLEPFGLDDWLFGGGYRHQEIAVTNRSLRRIDDLDWNAAGLFPSLF